MEYTLLNSQDLPKVTCLPHPLVAEEPAQAADSSGEHVELEGTTEGGWIQWYCTLEGNDFLVEIEEDYLRDASNLFGIKQKFGSTRLKYLP